MDLLVASRFQPILNALRRQLPQSLLLHGESGVGLTTLARSVAGESYECIQPVAHKTSAAPAISIDAIRELYRKTRGKHERHVIIIDAAETMTAPAQHAFLKLLEEPGPGVHFIVVTHLPGKLLPTVRSRLQAYHVPRVENVLFDPYLASLTSSDTERRQLQFIADGRPALARRLHDNPEQLEKLAVVMRDAQVFVGADRYQACRVAFRYSTTPSSALTLVEAGIRILQFSIVAQPEAVLVRQLTALTNIHERLRANAQPRLQLLSYVVQ